MWKQTLRRGTAPRYHETRPQLLRAVCLYDFPDDPGQIVFQLPVREVPVDLAQVRDVADVVAHAIFRLVAVLQSVAHAGQQVDGLQNGNAVAAPAAQVAGSRTPAKGY